MGCDAEHKQATDSDQNRSQKCNAPGLVVGSDLDHRGVERAEPLSDPAYKDKANK